MKSASVKENGQSLFSVDIDMGVHQLLGDEPEDMGGKDLGPSPYDLLTASLAECTAMTVRWYANRHGFPLEKVEAKVTHEKKGREDIFHKTVRIEGAQLSADQKEKLYEMSKKCPVHRTLQGNPQIESALTDADIS